MLNPQVETRRQRGCADASLLLRSDEDLRSIPVVVRKRLSEHVGRSEASSQTYRAYSEKRDGYEPEKPIANDVRIDTTKYQTTSSS